MQANEEKKTRVGGQAVIEGVMMRCGSTIATAVRRKNGEISTKVDKIVPWSKRNFIFGLPIIRGALNLIEMLSVGVSTLNWSADMAMQDEAEAKGETLGKKSQTWPAMLLGLVLGIGLFVLLPLLIAKLFGVEREAFLFNLVAGAVRIVLFMAYLIAISFLPDIKRLFQYHGAEHKSIFAFENGDVLSIANAQKYRTFHPRCGTSFLLIVAVVSILFFAVADFIIASILGFVPTIFLRFAIHLALWPLLAGLCYEVLKLSAFLSEKYRWAQIAVWPGLLMQRISTSEPTDDMVEVALSSLRAAVEGEGIKLEESIDANR
ncbi:DUF1385 domain-containing protein [bacterium]|nr:DUF1385 domain-containing protein [bacterium]